MLRLRRKYSFYTSFCEFCVRAGAHAKLTKTCTTTCGRRRRPTCTGALPFSRVGLLMNGLPTVAHKPSSDEYPRTRACGAAGDVLGRAEAAACLHVAGRSRQHGPSLEAGPLRWRPAGRPLWLADGPAWRVDGLASRP